MDDSKIFIVGASGQLGTALRQKYPNAGIAYVDELDITDKESVESYDWARFNILINAAAYTNVDGAETAEGRIAAWQVNADAVANLVAVAAQHDMTIVHISTEYVFDGTREIHNENEPFSPLSSYGASKAAGDIAVSLAPRFYILRITGLIGEGKNFVRTMTGLAENDISPNVVHDQIGRLTFTSELVRAIDHLLSAEADYGTYNVTNSGDSVSWADITREIFKILGREDLSVTNISTAEYYASKEGIAARPLQSTLDLTKLQSTGFTPRNWRDDLILYLDS